MEATVLLPSEICKRSGAFQWEHWPFPHDCAWPMVVPTLPEECGPAFVWESLRIYFGVGVMRREFGQRSALPACYRA